MAHIFVKNSLNNLKTVKIDINLVTLATNTSSGDPIFLIEAATTYPSISGTKIRPTYADKTIIAKNLDTLIDSLVGKIAAQIDWAPLSKDAQAPRIAEAKPLGTNVPIEANVHITIEDIIPSAGIDMSTATIIINNGVQDFDITNECKISGDPFKYYIEWNPSLREYKKYDVEE